MDTTLALTQKPAIAVPNVAPEQQPPSDKKVPVVKGLDAPATLPAKKPFVAQIVTARLSGTAFPENPGEIAPEERTLRPYDTPMLPGDKEPEEEVAEQTAISETDNARATGGSDEAIDAADNGEKTDRTSDEIAAERRSEIDEQPSETADTTV